MKKLGGILIEAIFFLILFSSCHALEDPLLSSYPDTKTYPQSPQMLDAAGQFVLSYSDVAEIIQKERIGIYIVRVWFTLKDDSDTTTISEIRTGDIVVGSSGSTTIRAGDIAGESTVSLMLPQQYFPSICVHLSEFPEGWKGIELIECPQ